jgi:hypothetical protein
MAAHRKALGVDSRGEPHPFGPPVLLKPGDPVRLWGEMHGEKDGTRRGYGRPEYGYVVEVKPVDDGFQDCFVDFYGRRQDHFIEKKGKPYRLRYFNTSLELLGATDGR